MGAREFLSANHLLDIREERRAIQKIRDDANDVKLKGIVDDLEAPDHRLILCAKNTGSYLTVWCTKLTGTLLGAMEFRGFW